MYFCNFKIISSGYNRTNDFGEGKYRTPASIQKYGVKGKTALCVCGS